MPGLMDSKVITVSSLDQLLQFNNLISSIVDNNNLAKIIQSIRDEQDKLKGQYDDLTSLQASQQASAKDLVSQTAINNQSIADLQKAKSDANNAQASADASVNKSQSLLKTLAQAQIDYDAKTQSALDDVQKRQQELSVKEQAVSDDQAAADALKSEYDEKINTLKKLTG